jgi:hypothetical protein
MRTQGALPWGVIRVHMREKGPYNAPYCPQPSQLQNRQWFGAQRIAKECALNRPRCARAESGGRP